MQFPIPNGGLVVKRRAVVLQSIIGAAALLFIFVQESHAYLDPGTGSFLLQLLLAGLFGLLLTVRIFWKRIKAFFVRLFGGEIAEEEQATDE